MMAHSCPVAPVLHFEDVCFRYNRQETLHNVSLSIHPGDFVAVVGPNGAGKSSFLKLALGLLQPEYGRVRLFGQKPERSRKRVGYVPQQMHFDPRFPLSVRDVVLLARSERHLCGFYSRQDKKVALESLDKLGILDLAKRPFADLSGGERQRAVLAQALATEPELLLLDEPTASVDPGTEQEIFELLRELNRHLTILVVSHNVNVVTRHASHVACVNRAASLVPTSRMDRDQLHETIQNHLAILRHHDDCHVLDPSRVLNTPHRGAIEQERHP